MLRFKERDEIKIKICARSKVFQQNVFHKVNVAKQNISFLYKKCCQNDSFLCKKCCWNNPLFSRTAVNSASGVKTPMGGRERLWQTFAKH